MTLPISMRDNPPTTGAFVLLTFCFCIGLLCLGRINGASGMSDSWPMAVMLASLSWIVVYMAASYSYYRTFYLLGNTYLIAIFMFHLGLIYQLATGAVVATSWTTGSMAQWMESAGWYVVLALCSFGFGNAISMLIKKPKRVTPQAVAVQRNRTMAFLRSQSMGLGIACFCFLFMTIISYGNIFAYSRAELFNLQTDTRGFGVLMMVLPSTVILFVVSAQTKTQKLMAYSLGVFVFLMIMLSGYRSAALFPALVGVILWVKSGKRIPTLVAVGAIFFVLIAISTVGVFRQMGSYDSLNSEKLQSSFEDASLDASITEMGQTVAILANVIKLVPAKDNHTYGNSYWLAFKEMFPNIGSNINSDKSRSARKDRAAFDQDELVKMKPADWITYRLNRWKFDNGQGVGFSAIAEPYLNFGTFGVVSFFILLGFLFGRLDMMDLITHPYLFLLMATIFWPFIRTVRNDFSNFTKPAGFILIIVLIWNISLKIIGRYKKVI